MSDFFCDVFGWGCPDHGAYVSHAAPEISPGAFLLTVILALGILAIDEWRRGRR